MPVRKIIEIDEAKCTGCGQCVTACAEGALQLVDGKAKLVGDILCDGLGACIGDCPEGALRIIDREAEPFDEAVVQEHLAVTKRTGHLTPLGSGCPGAATASWAAGGAQQEQEEAVSSLSHWPIKLRLVNPEAPFLKGSDLLLLADCTAAADPNLHTQLLRGRCVVMGCPKFDELEQYIERLSRMIEVAKPRSLTVAYMEVPCCRGFVYAAQQAIERASADIPLELVKIARNGQLLARESLKYGAAA